MPQALSGWHNDYQAAALPFHCHPSPDCTLFPSVVSSCHAANLVRRAILTANSASKGRGRRTHLQTPPKAGYNIAAP